MTDQSPKAQILVLVGAKESLILVVDTAFVAWSWIVGFCLGCVVSSLRKTS